MSDPRRLLAGEADEFEKELLGSWQAEQPSAAGRAKVLAAVGLGVGAAVAAGTAAAATKAGAAAGGSIAPTAATAGTVAILKWLAAAAIGVATAGAIVGYARQAKHGVAPRPAAPPPATVVAPGEPLTVSRAPYGDAVPSPPAASAQEPVVHAPAPPRRSAISSDPALGEQVSSLDRARTALGHGDAQIALKQLDDYEGRFPRGTLLEEAEVLRVEALLARGDRSSAARVGARFLAAHPDSPHAARIRALLGPYSAPGPAAGP